MEIGVLGMGDLIPNSFQRFRVIVKDHAVPTLDSQNLPYFEINGERIYLGVTGIYEIDHPIYITSFNGTGLDINGNLDNYYINYVITEE